MPVFSMDLVRFFLGFGLGFLKDLDDLFSGFGYFVLADIKMRH